MKSRAGKPLRPKIVRLKCVVCRRKLRPHEGKLCSCDNLLCIRHRYKSDHSCKEGLVQELMARVVPDKIQKI
jgi:hypothetical protein